MGKSSRADCEQSCPEAEPGYKLWGPPGDCQCRGPAAAAGVNGEKLVIDEAAIVAHLYTAGDPDPD